MIGRQHPVADVGPLSIVVVQPTSFCNLDCTYCYVPNRSDPLLMSEAVLAATFQKVFESDLVRDQVEILYHAGEPLAAGLSFYRRAVELADKANVGGIKVTHSIQTNGTLVNKKWAQFFAEMQFDLGISLDGPAFIHDKNRITRAGRCSHDSAVRGLRLLQDAGMHVGAICVLTELSLQYPEEIFDFFIAHDVPSVGFNIEETENAHRNASFLLNPAKWEVPYSNFFSRLYDRHRASPKLRIREFIDTLDTAFRIRRDPAYFRQPVEARDFGMITVNKEGKVTTYCPEFAGIVSSEFDNFVVGNILTQSLREMTQGFPFARLRTAIHESIKICASSCAFFEFCGGTHFSNKYSEHGRLDVSETATCRLHRQTLIRSHLASIEVDPCHSQK